MNESFEIDVLDSIEQISRESSGDIGTKFPGNSYDFLHCRETHFKGLGMPRYFRVHAGEETIAIGIAAIETGEDSFRLTSRIFGRLGVFLQPILGSLDRALNCGRIPGFGGPIIVRPGLDERRWISVICDAVERYAHTHHLTLVYSGVGTQQSLLLEELRCRGYLCGIDYPLAVLHVVWKDTDSYLKVLRARSKSYATTARKEMRRFQNSEISIKRFSGPDFTDVHDLLRKHHRRKNGGELQFGPEFLEDLSKRLGDDCVWYVARTSTRLVGVCLIVRRDDQAMTWLVGIDHEADGGNFTYFNLVFYYPCSQFPQLGVRRVHYGNAAQYAKQRRGCDIEEAQFFLKPPSKVTDFLLRPVFWIQRHIFRRKFRAALSPGSGSCQ